MFTKIACNIKYWKLQRDEVVQLYLIDEYEEQDKTGERTGWFADLHWNRRDKKGSIWKRRQVRWHFWIGIWSGKSKKGQYGLKSEVRQKISVLWECIKYRMISGLRAKIALLGKCQYPAAGRKYSRSEETVAKQKNKAGQRNVVNKEKYGTWRA